LFFVLVGKRAIAFFVFLLLIHINGFSDNAVRASGYARMPELKAPVAYSALPTEGFTSDVDSGLTLQGMFGGIMKRPELENHVRVVCVCVCVCVCV
jgi:hypothetical protein